MGKKPRKKPRPGDLGMPHQQEAGKGCHPDPDSSGGTKNLGRHAVATGIGD
jgi:hypothetical protein